MLLIISMKLIKGNFTVIFSPFDVYNIYNKDEYRLGGNSPFLITPVFFSNFYFCPTDSIFSFLTGASTFKIDSVNDYNLLISIRRENKSY